MALTENCELFCAIHEDGINQLIGHIRRKRPALFNYSTQAVANNMDLLCEPIDFAPEVITKESVANKENPVVTVEDPLPVLGTNGLIGLNFCAQLVELQVDFHPEGIVQLPPELSPLQQQHFAIHARVCVGIGCPSDEELVSLIPQPTFSPSGPPPPPPPPSEGPKGKVFSAYLPTVVSTSKLECLCIDLFAVCHFEIVGPKAAQGLVTRLDGVEIVDIEPNQLEANLECYIKLLIKVVILPRLAFALDTLVFEIPKLAAIAVSATPISAAVPNNPAIENDQLKVFISINITP